MEQTRRFNVEIFLRLKTILAFLVYSDGAYYIDPPTIEDLLKKNFYYFIKNGNVFKVKWKNSEALFIPDGKLTLKRRFKVIVLMAKGILY